jgi:tight adherence protein C
MSVFAAIVCSFWALSAAGLAWYCTTVARQITYVTLADGRRQERTLPLLFRLLLPLAPNLTHFFTRPAFAAAREKTDRKIVAAGVDGLLTSEEFFALRILVPVIMGAFWITAVYVLMSFAHAAFLLKLRLPIALLGFLWFFLYPSMWLKRTLGRRHMSIQRALPFVLDLLTLCVEAGMDFMTALQRSVEYRKIDPLAEEIIRVIRTIQLGKTRRESLRDMAHRVDLPDVRAVVSALVQADELGVSIGSMLRIQAEQMRQRRFERAEKLANEAPVKMLFPLMFFIFPSVFLILMGPIVMKLIKQVQ